MDGVVVVVVEATVGICWAFEGAVADEGDANRMFSWSGSA